MEMNRNLRQLVDNCFEEAQFDAAISTLDLLRSINHAPSPIHILHLLFISLHPTTHRVNLDNPDEQPLNYAALLQQSPRKIVKQSKSPQVLLPPSAVLAASRALHALLRTNGPSAFVNAIPFYPDSKSKSTSASGVATQNLEFVDSPINTNVLAIHSARNVWEVVKSAFTTRAAKAVPPPALVKTRTKQKLGLTRDASFTDTSISATDLQDVKPVGEHSWLALDWFVSLFEADAHASSSPKHSLLLLKQLPPPPLGSQTRWDASEPLKVVFHALSQKDPRKQHIGLRLLLLLIDFTRTIYLNHPAFASAVLAQLSSFSPPSSSLSSPSSSTSNNTSASPNTPHTPPPKKRRKMSPNSHQPQPDHQQIQPQALSHLFAVLPSDTPARVAFRMTLCRKILVGLSEDGDGDDGVVRSVKAGTSWSMDVDVDGGVGANGDVGANASVAANAGAGATRTPNGVNGGGVNSPTVNTTPNPNGIAKPRPRPKPILKKRKKPKDGDGEGKEEKEKEKEKAKIDSLPVDTPTSKPASACVSTPAPVPAPTPAAEEPPTPPPPPPAPIQRVPIPSLGELTRVLRLGLGLGSSGQSEGGDDMLMRVRFELVMAWIGVLRCGGVGGESESGSGSGSGKGKGKGKEGEEPKTVLDERGAKEELGRVLDEVFGRVATGGGEESRKQEEGEGEGEGMLYRRVLSAFVGV